MFKSIKMFYILVVIGVVIFIVDIVNLLSAVPVSDYTKVVGNVSSIVISFDGENSGYSYVASWERNGKYYSRRLESKEKPVAGEKVFFVSSDNNAVVEKSFGDCVEESCYAFAVSICFVVLSLIIKKNCL